MASPKTVDQLIIEIKADTKQLKKDLQQIQGKLKTTGAAGGAAFGSMAGALGKVKLAAVGVVAGLAVVGKTISEIAKVGIVFEDLKDSLNTVFGSIKAGDEALSRIMEFSQTTPFQVETVTKAFISLKSAGIEPSNRMLQVFADTASTSIDQLGVFEALIRTVQRSAGGGLGLEELNMIADRGIDVFGGLQEELGISRSEVAKFGATAEGAELIVQALINSLETKFGGAMESKMDNLSTKTSNMSIAFKQLADDIFTSGLDQMLKDLTDRMTAFAEAVLFARRSARTETGVALTGNVITDTNNLETKRFEIEKRIANLKKDAEMQLMIGATPLGEEPFESYEQSLERLTKQYRAINEELTTQGQLFVKLVNKRKEDNKTIDEGEKNRLKRLGELKQAATFLANEFVKLDGDTDMLAFTSANLGEIFENNKKIFQDMDINTLEDLKEKYKLFTDSTDDAAKTIQEVLAPAISQMSHQFTNEFVNALLAGENALESFRDFSKNIVAQIISTFLQMAVVNKILMSIFGPAGFNIAGFKLPTLASGGTVQKGQPTIVGERGAEIFVPNTGGTIMNNMNSRNAMGGTTTVINQSVNFATGVVPTVRAEVLQMLPQISDVTKNAVAEAAMKGGAYRRMLQGG